MDWLKPLEGGSWWAEPARSKPATPRKGPKVRTVGGVQNTVAERIAQARELAKVYRRGKVAAIMGVCPSTVTKWLGASYTEKRPYSKRGL